MMKGSRTIAPEENYHPILKLVLNQTLTLTGRGQLSGCPPTLKLTLTLTQVPTLTRVNFPWAAIVRIPS